MNKWYVCEFMFACKLLLTPFGDLTHEASKTKEHLLRWTSIATYPESSIGVTVTLKPVRYKALSKQDASPRSRSAGGAQEDTSVLEGLGDTMQSPQAQTWICHSETHDSNTASRDSMSSLYKWRYIYYIIHNYCKDY